MMLARRLLYAAALLVTIPAMAQRPLSGPDDFVDPPMHAAPLFLSRLVGGGVSNLSDHYRTRDGNAGFVLITNSLYVGKFQFNYKHHELVGQDDARFQRCDCPDPVYFPTPPPAGATPVSPRPRRGDTLQVAFYRTSDDSTLRFRISGIRQDVQTIVTNISTGEVERTSGHDQSFTIDADTHFRFAGLNVWGSVVVARTSLSATPDRRAQSELGYVSRLPGFALGPFLFRGELTLAGITGRDAPGINVINPYLEAIWQPARTGATLHLAWSVEGTKSGAEGWRTNHQIAISLVRTLYVRTFGHSENEQ